MTFEEFFKKKRIDLAALEKAEQALFSEFKTHFSEMGEKSFDHTKKYCFNKLRRQFQLAPELKTEKLHIANPLAEQTITESLAETTITPPTAKLGFAPKFKAGVSKHAANLDVKNAEPLMPDAAAETAPPPAGNPEAKPAAYQPRFKIKPNSAADPNPTGPFPEQLSADKPAAYQPRFKMEPKVEENTVKIEPEESAPVENTATKPAYQPRFKMKPKVVETEIEGNAAGETENPAAHPEEIKPPKPAYKPRFVPPKPKE